jgi:hypothetical protein
MLRVSRQRIYDNECLCRMEAIFERTCLDLKIDDQSDYARSAREALASLLFSLPPPEPGLIQPAAEQLTSLARSYGLTRDLERPSDRGDATPEA